MTKIHKNLILIISILILTCQNAFCYVINSTELNRIITSKLKYEAINKLNINQSDTEIKINIINTPDSVVIKSQKPKIEITPINTIQPDTYRRITIKNADNTVAKIFNAKVQTSVIKEVLVAKESIPFNKEINSQNAHLEKADILKYHNKVLTHFEDNLIAKRNYQKGNVIIADYAKPKAQISKNSNVDIVFLSKGVRIKLQGKALKDGNIGDTILVRSEKYNKIYSAKVNSSNEVVVKI